MTITHLADAALILFWSVLVILFGFWRGFHHGYRHGRLHERHEHRKMSRYNHPSWRNPE